MNLNRYEYVLKNHPVDIVGSDWIFQEDNVPVHWSEVNRTFQKIKCSTLFIVVTNRTTYKESLWQRTKEQLKTTI